MRDDNAAQAGSLWGAIIWSQLYVFLGVTILSLLLTSYLMVFEPEKAKEAHIVPEVLILLGVGFFFARHYRRRGESVVRGLLWQVVAVFGWAVAALLVWAVVLAIGWAAQTFIAILSRNNTTDIIAFVVVAMVLGLNGLLYAFHFRVRKMPKAEALRGLPLQSYLWPIVLVMVLLMFPLWLQETANSPKLQAMKYEKPIRQM